MNPVTERLRRPALAPPPVRTAWAHASDPSDRLVAHYQQVWQEAMHDMPFVNPALQVESLGFVRHEGDWLGVVVTPWFLNLFLLFGGGRLWHDISAGERRYVDLPCGRMQFMADDDPALGPTQYCPLVAPVSTLADAAVARQVALDAMQAVMTPAPQPAPDPAGEPPAPSAPTVVSPARRGFMRRLAGGR